MLIDTHAHLDFEQFDSDRDKIIMDAYRNGIKKIINVGADLESSQNSAALAEEYEFIYASVGVHPHEARGFTEESYQELKQLAANNDQVVAIGEIGLDYYYDNSPRAKQREVFKEQLALARELDLPVAIHSREAKQDTLDILEAEAQDMNGVLHCYAYDLETAQQVLDWGFYIALGGIVTFNGADELRMAVPNLPLEKILVETDAPYLAPAPHRGDRNQPKYVEEVAREIAELKNTTLEKVERITTKNAENLFELN